jgi:hypothetical protein
LAEEHPVQDVVVEVVSSQLCEVTTSSNAAAAMPILKRLKYLVIIGFLGLLPQVKIAIPQSEVNQFIFEKNTRKLVFSVYSP